MTAEAIPVNPEDYDKATPTQAKTLGNAIQQLSLKGDSYHDEDTGIDAWGFSKRLDPLEALELPKTVMQHFPEADGPIEGYDLVTLWSPMASEWRPEDADTDFVTIERTTVHPTWKEVVALKYELAEPTDTNPSGIKRDVSIATTAIATQPTGTDVAGRPSEGEVLRMTEEALHAIDDPYEPGADESDDLSGLGLTEASQLISFVRRVTAQAK